MFVEGGTGIKRCFLVYYSDPNVLYVQSDGEVETHYLQDWEYQRKTYTTKNAIL